MILLISFMPILFIVRFHVIDDSHLLRWILFGSYLHHFYVSMLQYLNNFIIIIHLYFIFIISLLNQIIVCFLVIFLLLVKVLVYILGFVVVNWLGGWNFYVFCLYLFHLVIFKAFIRFMHILKGNCLCSVYYFLLKS